VVDTATVEQWLDAVLALDWKKVEPAGYTAAHLARMTGDRSRDINDTLRAEVLRRLNASSAPPTGAPWCAKWCSSTRPMKSACWATPCRLASS
jgi:hypothetical protein